MTQNHTDSLRQSPLFPNTKCKRQETCEKAVVYLAGTITIKWIMVGITMQSLQSVKTQIAGLRVRNAHFSSHAVREKKLMPLEMRSFFILQPLQNLAWNLLPSIFKVFVLVAMFSPTCNHYFNAVRKKLRGLLTGRFFDKCI